MQTAHRGGSLSTWQMTECGSVTRDTYRSRHYVIPTPMGSKCHIILRPSAEVFQAAINNVWMRFETQSVMYRDRPQMRCIGLRNRP